MLLLHLLKKFIKIENVKILYEIYYAHNRLNSFVLIFIENYFSKNFDYEQIIMSFVTKNARNQL